MRDEKFKAVCALDPAIDLTIPEMLKYLETRDFALLRFVPGDKPTIFHVREVPHGLWESYVAATDSLRERYRRAFQAGVERVENLMQNDGVTVPNWAPTYRHPTQKDVVMMSDQEANAMFAPAEREEIGAVVYQHSFLPRRIKCSYQLPPSLAELLGTRTFRPVDASPSTALAPSNEKPSESSTQSQVETASA